MRTRSGRTVWAQQLFRLLFLLSDTYSISTLFYGHTHTGFLLPGFLLHPVTKSQCNHLRRTFVATVLAGWMMIRQVKYYGGLYKKHFLINSKSKGI